MLVAFLISIGALPAAEAAVYDCDDCSTCTPAIAGAASGDTVRLNASIFTNTTCIDFNGKDGIIFDCQGNTIYGPFEPYDILPDYVFGIYLPSGSNNNIIRNCIVSNFYHDIYMDSSSGNSLINVTTNVAFQIGVFIKYGTGNTIANLEANAYESYMGAGLSLYSCTGTIVNGITVTDSDSCIMIDYQSGNTIINATCRGNSYGLNLAYTQNNTIRNSRIEDCEYGIYLIADVLRTNPIYASNNSIYNNILSNEVNLYSNSNNNWNNLNVNLDCASGPNIVGGSCIGGNFWTLPLGAGYSDMCADSNGNGICDSAYAAAANNTDNYPLTIKDITPPTTPTGLTARAVSSDAINLEWNAASDDVMLVGYKIYRDGSYIGTNTATGYQDQGLSPSTTYTYTVSAYDATGKEGGQSAPASAATYLFDNIPPTAPTGLNATAISSTRINLSWNAATDNGWVEGYIIYRDGIYLDVSETNATIYLDEHLYPSTTYTYTVSAYDGAGIEGEESYPASVTTLPPPCAHEADNNPCDGCVVMSELTAFVDRWKVNNEDVTLRELIGAIGLWKRGCI